MKKEVARLKADFGGVPHLVNVMVGSDPGSCAYASSQKKTAEYIGIKYELKILSEDTTQAKLISVIKELDADSGVHGIMIHKPVPDQIDYRAVANYVAPSKDLEGINVTNIGKMMLGQTRIIPCTPAAVIELIRSTGVKLRGKEAVVVGHSEIVGKPLKLAFARPDATVTVCHLATTRPGGWSSTWDARMSRSSRWVRRGSLKGTGSRKAPLSLTWGSIKWAPRSSATSNLKKRAGGRPLSRPCPAVWGR